MLCSGNLQKSRAPGRVTRFKPLMSKLQINREVMGGKHEVSYKERLTTGREGNFLCAPGSTYSRYLHIYIYILCVYLSYIYFLNIYLMMWLVGAYVPRSIIDVLGRESPRCVSVEVVRARWPCAGCVLRTVLASAGKISRYGFNLVSDNSTVKNP